MHVAYLVFRPDSLTYLAASALTTAGSQVDLWAADPEHGRIPFNEYTNRLLKLDGARLAPAALGGATTAVDRLIIQMFPRPDEVRCSPALPILASHARRITLISAGDRSRYWRSAWQIQWRELGSLRRWLPRIDRIAYKDGYHPVDLFAPLKRRSVTGFGVHSMFMESDDALDCIQRQDWDATSIRPQRINFLGSQDPVRRKRILDSIRAMFDERSYGADGSKPDVWHEYSDARPGALALAEFVEVLSRSDFTLCPPGYSLITHRVVEALLRGSIPIVHAAETDIYDIGLEDGVNCIAVPPQGWPAAVERCRRMDETVIRAMRWNIRGLIESHLLHPASSRRMRQRLGITEGNAVSGNAAVGTSVS